MTNDEEFVESIDKNVIFMKLAPDKVTDTIQFLTNTKNGWLMTLTRRLFPGWTIFEITSTHIRSVFMLITALEVKHCVLICMP